MQRQSLGSPASKLYIYGGKSEDASMAEDSRRRESASSSSSSPLIDLDDHELKATRPRRLTLQAPLSPSHSKPEKLIHFIPVLMLLCFLILYLSSHTPSQTDLANFKGFKRSPKRLDKLESAEINDDSRFTELRRGDVLAIRSLRNLQKVEKKASRSRFHRKIADF